MINSEIVLFYVVHLNHVKFKKSLIVTLSHIFQFINFLRYSTFYNNSIEFCVGHNCVKVRI